VQPGVRVVLAVPGDVGSTGQTSDIPAYSFEILWLSWMQAKQKLIQNVLPSEGLTSTTNSDTEDSVDGKHLHSEPGLHKRGCLPGSVSSDGGRHDGYFAWKREGSL